MNDLNEEYRQIVLDTIKEGNVTPDLVAHYFLRAWEEENRVRELLKQNEALLAQLPVDSRPQ